MHHRVLPLQLLAVFLAALPASALADSGAPSIRVEQAWSRAAAQGRVGVLYATVTDSGAPDRLVGIDSPVADRAELHESMGEGGVMRMRPVDGIDVAPGKPIVLKPGGYHAMLIGLHRALREGDSFAVTLHFAMAGAVEATALVTKAGAAGPSKPAVMPPASVARDHGGAHR